MRCAACQHELREGAAFCAACGAPQQPVASPVATTLPPTLAIDAVALRHLAVSARGLVRWRVDGATGATVTLRARFSGTALPETTAVAPTVLAVALVPEQAGVHELTGELAIGDAVYAFAGVHVVVAAVDAPSVHIVNIDQSSARVVDNSRSSFGGAGAESGLLGDGEWQPVPIALARATPTPAPFVRAPVSFAVTTETATYRVTETIAAGDITTVYAGTIAATGVPVALKIADQASDNDLLQHEARVLGLLLATPDKTSLHFNPPRDQFRTSDGRLGTVFDRLDGPTGGLDLTELRERCRRRGEPGLPARHVVWVLRRALAALGWAHSQGILHGNLDPSHLLVRGHDHMLWVVDWCWAVIKPATTGEGFKALNETYSAPEVRERGRPTPASDLYALGKCMIWLAGGDPTAKAFPPNTDVDPRLARFLKYLCVESQGGRAQDAWEQYLAIDKVRQLIWGEHEFVRLEI